ncbi:MAG: alkaline phosphatase [Phycisphaerales bacterium]|nr:alkaline phosphatase [Phycisphaerales bacterium]
MPRPLSRRRFLTAASSTAAAAALAGCTHGRFLGIGFPRRPVITGGVASGDVTADSAIIWSATDRGARMHVEWDTTDSFKSPTRVIGPDAVTRTGFAAKLDLQRLPPDTRIFYRVCFENLDDFSLSQPAVGSFKTAPVPNDTPRDITFTWSGDTAGQGWGIDPARGGMRIYKAIADMRPDFFIHSGDTIYADIPIPPEIKLPDGTSWKNIVTPAKSKPAQTLEDFRGAHAYNLLDSNVRYFNACVPMIAQWDDHEVHNNWNPGQKVNDPAYQEQDYDILSARARQAFLESYAIRLNREDPHRIYRSYNHGPLLEVFMLDERSYRGVNSPNRQPTLDHAADFLGPPQLEWLKTALKNSTALWKVIASDMPISAISKDPIPKDAPKGTPITYEAWANGDPGAPLGRELELANLLSFIKSNHIKNTLWITADVHYAANIHYHPDRAAFKNFDPFWEFISGPLHAGGFGPNPLDKTFGPEYRWKQAPKKSADGPGHNYGFFGAIHIDAQSRIITVTQHDIDGKPVATQTINPT